MERARSEWIDELGLGVDWRAQHGVHFVVHSATIQYMKPAKVHERLEVVSLLKSARSASFIVDQHLRLAGMPDKILCKAEIKIACVDKTMLPCAIPGTTFFETIRRSLS